MLEPNLAALSPETIVYRTNTRNSHGTKFHPRRDCYRLANALKIWTTTVGAMQASSRTVCVDCGGRNVS